MKLLTGEKIFKVYHHHPLFFMLRVIKVWGASLPFFFVAFVFAPLFNFAAQVYLYGGIITLFALATCYDMLIYYLDTLVLTNKRLVHLDWINPFKYVEIEAMLDDIQNVESQESGFLSKFKFFDFGTFILETASTKMTITFPEAPDPEGIKFFIYNISKKHNSALVEKEEICEPIKKPTSVNNVKVTSQAGEDIGK